MIVVFTTPAMGHLKPMLPVLRGLCRSGIPVTCYGHLSFEGVIRSSGAGFLPYPEVSYDVERPDFNLVRMAADIIDASDAIADAVLPQVRAMAPRLILQDSLALWGGRVGTALGIPASTRSRPSCSTARRCERCAARTARPSSSGTRCRARCLWRALSRGRGSPSRPQRRSGCQGRGGASRRPPWRSS